MCSLYCHTSYLFVSPMLQDLWVKIVYQYFSRSCLFLVNNRETHLFHYFPCFSLFFLIVIQFCLIHLHLFCLPLLYDQPFNLTHTIKKHNKIIGHITSPPRSVSAVTVESNEGSKEVAWFCTSSFVLLLFFFGRCVTIDAKRFDGKTSRIVAWLFCCWLCCIGGWRCHFCNLFLLFYIVDLN